MTTSQLVRPAAHSKLAPAHAGPAAADLIDQARAFEAQALGKRMEACMLLGEREQARVYMDQMNTIVITRRAAAQAKADSQGEEGDRTLHVQRKDL
jgi:hypothetical protein